MNPDDIIILLLLYSERERIAGRTLLQKFIYFLNKKLDLRIEFNPYYYGPYSPEIADALENLNASGIIREEVLSYTPIDFRVTFEPRKYIYQLTPAGEEISKKLEKDNPVLAGKIKATLESMREYEGVENYKTLSIAAKMHNILELENRSMSVEEILEESKVLGWFISEEDAKKALDLLENLNMIKINVCV